MVRSLVLVVPIPPFPHWELKPRTTNIHFKNPFHLWLSRKHTDEGVPFWAMPCEWPLPFHSYCTHTSVTITFTSKHTQKHMQADTYTLMRVFPALPALCVYDGYGVTKTGLILALNIWCAERSLVCVFHQDVPHCLSPLFLAISLVRDGKETLYCLKK